MNPGSKAKAFFPGCDPLPARAFLPTRELPVCRMPPLPRVVSESWPAPWPEPSSPQAAPGPPHRVLASWADAFPWVVQGITTRGWPVTTGEDSRSKSDHDMRLFGKGGAGAAQERWEGLRRFPGVRTVVHARQVHGAVVRTHHALPPALHRVPDADGHLTAEAGILLAVTVADCVPVYLLGEHGGRRGVALLHAGWRGVVAGIVEAGVAAFRDRLGIPAPALFLHLGPAIGRTAYEVGPEVHQALGLPVPPSPTPVDLRGVVAERAGAAGVSIDHMSISSLCTRSDAFHFSHRGGDEGRQVAFLGLREGRA